ncbi:MAG TPA: DNA-binding protein [Clostridiales bacterium UBA9857]|nr:DNA-binding protein [Candidatus Fermentithermobacillaceae bacterium]HAF66156.1 DNA-binding protein [Clostridiales bacterium UBA9857]
MLRDIYESLLPPRQRQVAYLKFDEDLSLSEIAQRLGISKQGCDDAVRRCVKALLSYEDKLGFRKRLAHIEQAVELAESINEHNWREMKQRILEVLRSAQAGGETGDGV